jgi:hypothetical protein
VDQESVGRGIPLAQPAKQLRRRIGTRLEERLPRHHLEQVTALERIAREAHAIRVFAGGVVAGSLHARGTPIRLAPALAREPVRGAAIAIEVVTPAHRPLASVIDDDELVGQVEDQIALVFGTREAQAHGLELEGQVVAEGAVEPEVGILRTGEEPLQRANHREDRRLLAALLFREARAGLRHASLERRLADLELLDRRDRLELGSDPRQQDAAAFAVAGDPKAARTRHELERRIDEAHVPTRVASRVLVIRGEERTAPLVERVDQRLDCGFAARFLELAPNLDAAPRAVLVAGTTGIVVDGHFPLLVRREPSRAVRERTATSPEAAIPKNERAACWRRLPSRRSNANCPRRLTRWANATNRERRCSRQRTCR